MDREFKLTVLPQVQQPARYIGNEWNAVHKDHSKVDLKVALAFPDAYEVGMSHLGMKILYHLINKRENWVAERVFAPWVDMEEKMRKHNLSLYGLESHQPVKDFDVLGFTLQYEMSYTNILNMLDLAGIPVLQKDRTNDDPLIMAGGPVAYNPEPLADFIDLFYIGEAEEMIEDILEMVQEARDRGIERDELLFKLSKIQGIYIPSLYQIEYDEEGKVVKVEPTRDGVPEKVQKQVVNNLDKTFYPEKFIVPYSEIVHDRVVLEIARGCTRGCRFCQAGMIYRPVRERSPETVKKLARKLIDSTGYDEMSLVSLSSSDYSGIKSLAQDLVNEYTDLQVSVSLPSLRIDSFSIGLAKEVQRVRKSGMTFAPEAGTQRMRDVINKGVTEENLIESAEAAAREGWTSIKLYFMQGLPTEKDEDIEGIAELSKKVSYKCDKIRKEKERKPVKITVSVSNFVPKPHTPFQWESMDSIDEIKRKQDILKKTLRGKWLSYNWHGAQLSIMEGVMARGDRRIGEVLYTAWQNGAKFDGWREFFDYQLWVEAFKECSLDPQFYLDFPYQHDEILPWDHIDTGVSKDYLWDEYQNAVNAEFTPDCRFDDCTRCDCCGNLDVAIQLLGDE